MKRFVGIAVLIMLQLGIAVGWVAYGAEKGADNNWVQSGTWSLEEKRMQENLAMWYNLNLSENGEGEILEGYGQILYFDDGLMCWVEFSEDRQSIPVWHGTRGKQNGGLTHLSRSALPIGGYGNHTVLTGGEDVLDGTQLPERGATFVIHTLGDAMVYRIMEVKVTKREPSLSDDPQNRDLCSLWIRRGTDWVIIRAVREKDQT